MPIYYFLFTGVSKFVKGFLSGDKGEDRREIILEKKISHS
jgi:hypothetical protein